MLGFVSAVKIYGYSGAKVLLSSAQNTLNIMYYFSQSICLYPHSESYNKIQLNGWLMNNKVISHGSGDRKSSVKVLADPMSTKNLVHRQLSSGLCVLKWQGVENSLGPL